MVVGAVHDRKLACYRQLIAREAILARIETALTLWRLPTRPPTYRVCYVNLCLHVGSTGSLWCDWAKYKLNAGRRLSQHTRSTRWDAIVGSLDLEARMNLSEAISRFEEKCKDSLDYSALEAIRAALAVSPTTAPNKPSAPCVWYHNGCDVCTCQPPAQAHVG